MVTPASSHRSLLKPRDLWRLCVAVYQGASRDNLTLIAAGVAFYTFLALLPALVAVVLIYGVAFDRTDVLDHVALLEPFAPRAILDILTAELTRIVATDNSALGLGAVGSFIVSVWSSTKGARALVQGLNMVENEPECRGAVQLYLWSLVFTVVAVLAVAVVLALLVALPSIAAWLPSPLPRVLDWLRWLVAPAVIIAGIALLYRFGSCRPPGPRRIVGTLVAAVVWLLASYLFHRWIEDVASTAASYGSLSAVVVFMLWLYVTSLAILLGAEVDAVLVRWSREKYRE